MLLYLKLYGDVDGTLKELWGEENVRQDGQGIRSTLLYKANRQHFTDDQWPYAILWIWYIMVMADNVALKRISDVA